MHEKNNQRPYFGVGVDIENIDRFRKLATDNAFLHRVFTQRELDYCLAHRSPAAHLAVRFAAKEAIIKALSGLNRTSPGYKHIEITNRETGLPIAHIRKEGFEKLHISLSLSHSRTQAIAFTIITEVP